jgi:hypothetical protein
MTVATGGGLIVMSGLKMLRLPMAIFVLGACSAATAADLPQQFDLLCDAHGNSARIEPPSHLHIDLKTGNWCENTCSVSHGGASISGQDIILEDKVRTYDTGYKSTELQSINVETLNFFGMAEAEQGGQFIYRFPMTATCQLAAFTGVSGPMGGW